ncbi:MAG: hypothetical protein EKK48_18995 [Candidatus Melainabacteria bacterium]|nr:MAG: hypothetical protein EKK48_18995 [Candidatus Melainabacteria bacterium]
MTQDQNGTTVPPDQTSEPVPQVQVVNGKFVFEWTGLMTGCQSKIVVLEEFAKQHPNSELSVIFSSEGGGVDDCRKAYNSILLIRAMYSVRFVFIVVKAQSCALWFIQCADVRIGLPRAALMYHCVRWDMKGPQSAADLKRAQHSIERNQKEFTQILCSRAAKPKKAARKLAKKISDGFDHIFSAEEAVENGWLDVVYEPVFVDAKGYVSALLAGNSAS